MESCLGTNKSKINYEKRLHISYHIVRSDIDMWSKYIFLESIYSLTLIFFYLSSQLIYYIWFEAHLQFTYSLATKLNFHFLVTILKKFYSETCFWICRLVKKGQNFKDAYFTNFGLNQWSTKLRWIVIWFQMH